MGERETLSRRGFLKGTAVGLASGLLATASAGTAFAGTEENRTQYQQEFKQDMGEIPVKKVKCPGPRGPISFEDRTIADSEIGRTEECDVLVIGAGIGGLMATLKAADMGAKVVTLEKMTKGRGCFECFGAVGAKAQAGLTIDKTTLLDEMYRAAYWRTRPEPIRTYVDRSGEATDFWQNMLGKGKNGFVISHVAQEPSTCGMPALTPIIDTELGFYGSPALPADAAVRSGLSGIYVCREMSEVAKDAYSNIDIRFSTPAVQLENDSSNACVGCIAKDEDGYFRVKASKGVILATGGYDANPEMMEAYTRPEDYASSSWWNPCWGTTGDGHMMGLKIGAQMDPCPHPVMNFRWGNPDSFYDARAWNAIFYGIMINADGKRFVREDLPFQCVSNAQNAQPDYGANCWEVFDETMFEGMEDAVEEFKQKGWLFEGSSPAELARACKIDEDGLAHTISAYNTYATAGKDADFGRDMSTALPFTGKRYFALTTNSCILATVGGLVVNENCVVLDNDNTPIKHLYAVGNASGGFFAGNYPRHIPGTSIGRAITFGYVAAENAVKGE